MKNNTTDKRCDICDKYFTGDDELCGACRKDENKAIAKTQIKIEIPVQVHPFDPSEIERRDNHDRLFGKGKYRPKGHGIY